MNRRGFFAAATALVLPYEPQRVYSFAKPRHLDTSLETTIALANALKDSFNRFLNQGSLADLVDDDHAQYLWPEDLTHGRIYGGFYEHIQRVIEAKGFCAWPTDKDYIFLEHQV
jgi:hypothetical protein